MLKVYDKSHGAAGYIKTYKNLKIESVASTGDKTLSFTYLGRKTIEPEYYIQTQTDEYVIKEKSHSADGFPQYVAILNLEELEGKAWSSFSVKESTVDEAARLALAGTGWTIGECDVKKKRNAGMLQVTSKDIIEKLATAFWCEIVYDTKKKKVSFYNETGEDKGTYFIRGLNLRKLSRKEDSYDYYTQIIPIGANSLTIEKVNDGKKYLENYQYSNKVKTYIWKDESYTDAQALKEDAELKLQDLSKPVESYSVTVSDLAKQKTEYSILEYHVGDKIWLIDSMTRTRVKQRIVKMTEYPQEPDKNTCEIASTVLTFEELSSKYKAAAEIVNTVVSGDGRYTGTISVSDILNFEQGLSDSDIVSGMKSSIDSLNGSVKEIKLTVGSMETNYLKVEDADLKFATIEKLDAVSGSVKELSVKYGEVESLKAAHSEFEDATAKHFEANEAKIKELDTQKLSAKDADLKYANIDFSNIGKLAMEFFYAQSGLIKDVKIGDATIAGELVGVTIKGDLIEGNTVKADKLVIKGSDGLYYKLNTDGKTVEEEQTDYNSLNGQVIRAKSVTAEKIDVKDLVAFGATIGGFKIGQDSIYSGVKETVDNTTRGIYMDNDGQFSLGDSNQYIKFYRISEGKYKLSVAIEELYIQGNNVADSIDDAAKTATNFMKFDSNGLAVGDQTADELGKNVLIGNDSVKIRNGDIDLARFAETLIELGLSKDFVLQILNNAIRFMGNDGSAAIAHIGYGDCNARNPEYDLEGDGDITGIPEYTILSRPYYTLGSRSSDSTQTSDIGEWSIGAGEKVLASGVDSVAVGYNTKATGPCAYAEGLESEATGECAHAEGMYCKATDMSAHAEGSMTEANGPYSHAEGVETHAHGSASHTGGEGTIAKGHAQTVIGTYNAVNDTHLLIIGNGLGDESRQNALEVWADGSLNSAGSVRATENFVANSNNRGVFLRYIDKTAVNSLLMNASDELCLGYGQYANGKPTKLYGNDISLFVKSVAASFRPYYRKGDSISMSYYGAGFVSNNEKEIQFSISLNRPLIGSPTITATSVNGLVIRQGGKYLYGSGGGSYAKPSKYSCSVQGNMIVITATMNNNTNVITKNDTIGVYASIKVTFS